jgi:hypothetical protein
MSLFHRQTKQQRAAVLGCGPAGMFAAHALVEKGWEVHVFSKRRRSEMFGAQYLHMPIPGLDGSMDPSEVLYEVWGTDAQYAEKVYGTAKVPFVSTARLRGQHQAWDIRRAYYDAYARYEPLIVDDPDIDGNRVGDEVKGQHWDLIVSTIPAPDICINPSHLFRVQEAWAIGDAPERGIVCPVSQPPMTVACNGIAAPAWYRSANVFGYQTAEWPSWHRPPLRDIAAIRKPIDTDCNCWEGDVVKVGRFGSWSKGELSHQAYYKLEAMA